MANIKKSAEELIGRTPLMELVNYEKAAGVTDAVILAKLEYFNPAGSVKDRIALQMKFTGGRHSRDAAGFSYR